MGAAYSIAVSGCGEARRKKVSAGVGEAGKNSMSSLKTCEE
jgi:hypothetical protein